MQIEASFHLNKSDSLTFKFHLERVYPILDTLHESDPNAKDWLLQGNSAQEAFFYAVYEKDGSLTKAADAVLETKYRKKNVKGVGVWNGEEDSAKAVSFGYIFNDSGLVPCKFSLEYHAEGISRLGGYSGLQSLINKIATTLTPSQISVSPQTYYLQHQVFKDRPGVGWMLYLPRVLTMQQVPEARALVPVMSENEKDKQIQIGTIIVSVTDEPFSDENSEHVKIANAIEIRLVDQDLLPLYSSL